MDCVLVRRVAACAGLALAASSAIAGTEFSWGAPASGSWSVGTNWTPIGVPNGAGHSAVIAAAGGPYTVTLDINPALFDLTLDSNDATLSMTSRTMTIGGLAWLRNGSVTMLSSVINGAGTLRNEASMLLEGSTTIGAAFEQAGDALIRGRNGINTTVTVSPAFTNEGLIDIAAIEVGAAVALSATNGMTNTGELRTTQGTAGTRTVSASTFVNDGLVNFNASTGLGAAGISGLFTNNGTWNVASGRTMSMNGANLTFTQAGGTLDVAGAFELSGATFNFNGGDVTGAGLVRLTNGNLNFGAGSMGAGAFVLRGAGGLSGDVAAAQTVTIRAENGINTNFTSAGHVASAGLIDLTAIEVGGSTQWTATGGFTNTGELRSSVGSGGTRTLASPAMVNNGLVNLLHSTTLAAAGGSGSFTNNGTWNIGAGSITSMSGANNSFTQQSGTLNVLGAMELSSATFNFNGGSITGGAPRLTNGTLALGAGTGSGTVVLRGTGALTGDIDAGQTVRIRGENAINTSFTAAGAVQNNGLIDLTTIEVAASSVFVMAGGLTNLGEVRTSAGNGGSRALNASTFDSTGTVNLLHSTSLGAAGPSGLFINRGAWTIGPGAVASMNGATLSFTQQSGTLDVLGAFELTNATFNFNGGFITGGAPRLTNGALAFGPGTGSGAVVMRGTGTLSGDIDTAQTVRVRGENGVNTSITTSGAVQNSGLIEITTIEVGASSALTIAAGMVNVGELRTSVGTGGSRALNASTFENDGAVNLNFATSLGASGASGVFTNRGVWTIGAGAVASMSGSSLTFTQESGTLAVLGALELTNARFNFNGGSITGGAPRLTNGTLAFGNGTGSGTVVMRGTGSLTGDVDAAQTVRIRGENAINTSITTAGAVQNSGLIEITTIEVAASSALTISGGLTNAGTLRTLAGTGGPRQISGSIANTGDVEVNASTTFGGANATHRNEGDWTIGAGATMTETASGTGGFVLAGGTLDVQGAFQAVNSRFRYEGGTTVGNDAVVQNGAMEIAGVGGDARFVLIGTPTLSGDIAANQTLTVRGQSGINTNVTGLGSFDNRGDLVLTTIEVGASSALSMAAGTMTNRSNGEIFFEAGTGGPRNLAVELDNRGNVAVRTAASLGRAGANSVNTGDVLIQSTSLTLSGASFTNQVGGVIRGVGALSTSGLGSFVNNGTISPGLSIGTLAVSGGFTQGATGVLDIEISGTGVSGSDRLTITGAAALGGLVDVTLLGGYTPDWGDRWSIMTYASRTGDMDLLAPTPSDPLLRWWSEATPTAFNIGVRHIADINHDDFVNFADLNLVLSFFNTAGVGLPGDANEDGVVDFADLNFVLSFFNTQAPPNLVPTPGVAGLLGIAALFAGRRRRD